MIFNAKYFGCMIFRKIVEV